MELPVYVLNGCRQQRKLHGRIWWLVSRLGSYISHNAAEYSEAKDLFFGVCFGRALARRTNNDAASVRMLRRLKVSGN